MASRARAVMVLGTASNAGKSLIATALCRIFARSGRAVAPFKAQNMSLNSAATPDGREIGRAQALQAEAAGVVPTSDMNPVLLKPTGVTGSQAVVDGRIWGQVSARDFLGGTKRALWQHVSAAYDRLAAAHELIVIEGAGSPAEINLRAYDIVNMSVAHYAAARALLVADIDRGGAFAAVAGTFTLLDARDRECIAGYAFNKFRGEESLLSGGIETLDARIGSRCLGVIPFIDVRGLDEEDGVSLERRTMRALPWSGRRALRVAVIAFPHLSNFTDFDALEEEPAVELRYVVSAEMLNAADVIVLPGTKSTLADLRWLRERALDAAILHARDLGVLVMGICGGLQMLGESIEDPFAVEGGGGDRGLGLLGLRSTFGCEKVTYPAGGRSEIFGATLEVRGYEIHAGTSDYDAAGRAFAMIRRGDAGEVLRDGAVDDDGRVFGTYLHGLFGDDGVRHAFVRWAREQRGYTERVGFAAVAALRNARIDALADTVERALDLDALVDR